MTEPTDAMIAAAARVVAERLCHGSVLNADVSMDYCLSCSDCGCRTMARAALIAAERAAWRPIETAPRDGTEIQVWGPSYRRAREVVWCDGQWWSTVGYGYYPSVTRWRPLPAPPKEGA